MKSDTELCRNDYDIPLFTFPTQCILYIYRSRIISEMHKCNLFVNKKSHVS